MKLYFLPILEWCTPSQGSKLQQFGLWILLFLSRSVKFAFTFFSYSNSSCKPKSPDSFETYQIHFQLVHDFAFSHLRISCTWNNVVTIFCNISFLVNFSTSYLFCVRMSLFISKVYSSWETTFDLRVLIGVESTTSISFILYSFHSLWNTTSN